MDKLLNKSISVVIPVLNEAGNMEPLVQRLDKALSPEFAYELVFIDDHSTDNTVAILQVLARNYPIQVHAKQGHRGKAYSLWEGFGYTKHNIIAVIDADLEYAPEDIPAMVNKLFLGADLVQSRRVSRKQKFALRNLASKFFHLIFIRVLHGLDLDTQSGLKVFRKNILSRVKPHLMSGWTFDLEFLTQTKAAGYKIVSYDIHFNSRFAGRSKIRFLSSSYEIGSNAVKLRLRGKSPIAVPPHNDQSMRGAGQVYKGKEYVTHSTLPHDISALRTFVTWQKIFIASVLLIVGFCIYLSPMRAAEAIIIVLSLIYFIDVVFNFYLIANSLNSGPEIKFSDAELTAILDDNLPVYTILCPLYREAHILPGFLEAISKLDWPKDKLDVQLLLEEDDVTTIEVASGMNLPDYVRVVVVPHSMPKTKPKACNYGLSLARGEYLVIYDAEDVPEPQQLKKAFLGFQTVDPSVKCLQAKLNYFNPHHNILTRLFTAEYSLWFDVILPGLQSINGYIPLGGTSNHFRTQDLVELKGWDPFNVTEDCDLGARLFKAGFTTAIIDSTTLEEANSNLKNWVRQRSRWIKGYMQSYLVHMRHPITFFRESRLQALVFQLVVGGKIAFMLINPLLWILTILYFTLRATVGPTIEALYPPFIFYIAVFTLLFGNFSYLYYYMIGCAKRGHWPVVKYVYMVPFYWLMTSVAAVMALYQLIVKPHFWEKTNHGLNLAAAKAAIKPESIPQASDFVPAASPRMVARLFGYLSPSAWTGGMILVVAMAVTNFINFIFNAFLGRMVPLSELALVTLVNTIWSLIGLLISATSTTVNYKTAFLTAQAKLSESLVFRKRVLTIGLAIVFAGTVLWLGFTPLLKSFFHLTSDWPILLFLPMFSFGFITAVNSGFLQGRLKLGHAAQIVIVESLSKLVAAGLLVYFGLLSWVFASIPISVVVVSLYSYALVRATTRKETVTSRVREVFPAGFYFFALFSSLSTAVFMNLDVLLVNHFLTPIQAGSYALLSLVGKMVFYFGSLPNALMVTFVSRDLGQGKNPARTFYFLLGFVTLCVTFISAVLSLFAKDIVPFLLGPKTLAILPYVSAYVLAMAVFTLASSFVAYHLARKQYLFPLVSLLMSLLMAGSIIVNHTTISSVVFDVLGSSLIGLAMVIFAHVWNPNPKFLIRWFEDLKDAFRPVASTGKPGFRRILIFNWRDTKHVYAGGAEIYIQEMAKRWVEGGNSVTIFSGNDGKSSRSEVIDGVQIIRRGGFYFVYFWAVVYYFFQFRGKFDLIIDCQNGIPFFTPFYAREQIFCLMHHVHQEVFTKSLSAPLALFARLLENMVMPLVYRNVEFITISESSKREIQDLGLGEEGIYVINPGVNLSELTVGQKSSVPTVVYVGRLKAYKSVDVLIKAFFLVLSKSKDAKLIIAGSGEEAKRLKRLVTKMDLDASVEFRGKVTEREKVKLLQEAWVFVNPSFMEGWGITTIEANACGTPIVAADVPGLRDSVQSPASGFLVAYGDYAEFANKINMIIDNRAMREEMGRQARTWAEKFDWNKTSKDFLKIIDSKKDLFKKVFMREESY